jgi:anti-anti-sigma factor
MRDTVQTRGIRTASVVSSEAALSILRQPACTIARLRSALDITTGTALRECLLGVLRRGMTPLIVDLSAVSSCDVAGLAVLIGAQRQARARGITFCLAAPRPQVTELLRSTGLDCCFTICATLADALPSPLAEAAAEAA